MAANDRKPAPAFGEPLPSAHPSADTIELLTLRRSTAADLLGAPGPDPETLDAMLAIAARTPDHRRVTPFRFMVFEGAARAQAGEILGAAFAANEPDASQERVAVEAQRFLRAPIIIAVISSVNRDHKTPEWEQVLTTGAVCQNLLVAASAHGYAAQWLTEWYAYDEAVLEGFGLRERERIAGYVYIGTARELPKERQRPVMKKIISRFGA